MSARERQDIPVLTPSDIYDRLDRFVIGQRQAKRVVALAAYNHMKRVGQTQQLGRPKLRKSNVLLIGPTGVGKTHIARNLANILNLPFTICDATEFTEAGYYGKDVEVMVSELLFAADMNVEACQRGIIFVDEIDKIARRSGGMRTGAGNRDIGGEGVQQGLLKLLEGRRIFVPYNLTQHWNKHDFVEIDTTNILFICAGTFTDIRNYQESGNLGFSESKAGRSRIQKRISQKKLLEYGMLTELLGRIPVVVQLADLSVEELKRILVEPQDSFLKEFQELLTTDDVTLNLTDGALTRIAEFAYERQIGARGLRSILEELLHDILFDAPNLRGQTIRLDARVVSKRLAAFDSSLLDE